MLHSFIVVQTSAMSVFLVPSILSPKPIISALHLPQWTTTATTTTTTTLHAKYQNPKHKCSLQKPTLLPSSLVSAAAGVIGISLVASVASGDTASATDLSLLGSSIHFSEPENALSLPTWAIHVSSVAEWIIAMVLVWKYGSKSGYESWKGLSWGMVPLLGGAFCACTWHFFYNAESLSALVALQAALTVVGNCTMCIAAFRIYKSSQEGSGNL